MDNNFNLLAEKDKIVKEDARRFKDNTDKIQPRLFRKKKMVVISDSMMKEFFRTSLIDFLQKKGLKIPDDTKIRDIEYSGAEWEIVLCSHNFRLNEEGESVSVIFGSVPQKEKSSARKFLEKYADFFSGYDIHYLESGKVEIVEKG